MKVCNDGGETECISKQTPSPTSRDESHVRGVFGFLTWKGLDPPKEGKGSMSALGIAAACGKGNISELFQHRKA